MGTNTGTIKLNNGGVYGEFYPKTVYEAVIPSPDSNSNLSVELESIKTSQSNMKSKLDNIENGANKYVHPTTSGNKHIPSGGSTGQILRWSADGTAAWGAENNTTYSVVTTTSNGLMSSADKIKLDGIAAGANKYVHPTTSGNKHIPSGGSTGQILRWSADGTAVWGSENNTTYSVATTTADGLMSSTDKSKLDGIAAGANKYVHPDNANTRHVTDTQIAAWTDKETTTGSQAKADAALTAAKSYTDTKVAALVGSAPETLDTLEELATALKNNEDLATSVAETIGNKVDKVTGMGLSETSFTTAEKTKLSKIADNANYYVHPTTTGNKHIPSGGVAGQILRWSASGTAVWGNEVDTTYAVVSKTSAGLVPQLPDETKTTKYLRQDGTWVVPPNTTYGVASTTANGLMSSTDKSKLDGIATGANNYTHPTSSGNKHIPSGGSSGQILRWSADGTAVWGAENNTTYSVATTTANGLMSSADKAKLDGATNVNTASKIVMRDSSGNFSAGTITATLSGNASTATKLQTARTITIGSTGKRFDGSGNVTWTLAEIGAAASSHTHNYAGSSSAGGAANSAVKLATARNIALTGSATGSGSFDGSTNISISTSVNKVDRVNLTGKTIDVNTYTLSAGSPTSQHYIENTTGGATNISNIPVKEPFLLDVELIRYASTTDYITKQTFISATTKSTYERFCTNGTWSSWLPTTRFTANPTSGQVLVADGTAGGVKTSGFTIASSVPSNAKFTDTTYGVATTSANGLMSSTDKRKLDGIATGANNYTHPTTSGNKHIPSGGSTGQILRWSADGTAVWGAENNTTYSLATTSANGLMSSTDKAKLDGATNANTASKLVMRDSSGNFSAGTITASLSGNASTATKLATARTITIGSKGKTFDGSANVTWTLSEIGAASTAVATTSTNGLMSSADKSQLNTLKAENERLRNILAMFAIMNGCTITTSASIADIETAITELYTNRGTSQFIYGAIVE